MNPAEAFAVGIAPMHLPALVAALLVPVIVVVARRIRRPILPGESTVDGTATVVRQWAAWL